jgi:hypothetical protein
MHVAVTKAGEALRDTIRSERTDALHYALRHLSNEERRALAEATPVLEKIVDDLARTSMNVKASAHKTFSSLSNPNYRKYFFGQTTSLVGTWMQMTAQSWLVFTLTHSATDIGFVVALQTLPVLLLGPYGGVVADRVDKRRLMIVLQAAMGLQAAVLSILALTHVVTYLDVCILAIILGLNNAFENPSRQSFVLEMVGPKDLRNAVSLNSTMNNVARAVGPAIAGVIIASIGEGWCFAVNALSFIAVVASLMVMDRSTLSPSVPTERAKGQLFDGFRYVAATPKLLYPLIMMGLVGMLAYEFQVTLPIVAGHVFHGSSEVYGTLAGIDGRRRRHRRSLDGGERQDRHPRDGPCSHSLWRLHHLCGIVAKTLGGDSRPGTRGFRERPVPRDDQLDAAT